MEPKILISPVMGLYLEVNGCDYGLIGPGNVLSVSPAPGKGKEDKRVVEVYKSGETYKVTLDKYDNDKIIQEIARLNSTKIEKGKGTKIVRTYMGFILLVDGVDMGLIGPGNCKFKFEKKFYYLKEVEVYKDGSIYLVKEEEISEDVIEMYNFFKSTSYLR